MTTQTIVGTPTLPRVNLLPPEIAEARTLRNFRAGAGGAVAVAVVVVGFLYWNAHSGVATAQSALDASKTRTTQLGAQVSGLQGVTQLKAKVASAQSTLASALAPEILWSHYLQDMSVNLAGNYWFTNMALSENTTAPGTTAVSPLADANAVGTVSFQGKAVTHDDVSKLLTALAKETGLSHPTFSSSAEDASPIVGSTHLVTFSVSASVDSTGRPSTGAAPATPTSTGLTTPTAAGVTAAGVTAAGVTAAPAAATPTGATAAGTVPVGSPPTTATVSGATPTPAGH